MKKPSFSIYLRTGIFYIAMGLFTIVYTSIIAVVGPALPYEKRFKWAIQGYTKVIIGLLRYCCNVHYELHGTENIPEKPCIIYSKHQSTWETFFLQNIFAPQTQVVKKELLNMPFFGWALSLGDPIAIDRTNKKEAIKEVIIQGKERLDRGIWVLIFPEGTRTPCGQRKKFTRGGATLAKATDTLMLPVAHNAGEHWPTNTLLKFPGTIKVVFGPVVNPHGKDTNQITSEAEAWINNTVENISAVKSESDLLSYAIK